MKLLADIQNKVIDPKVGTATANKSFDTLTLFITNFVKITFVVGGLAFFFMLLWGAIEYITAGGEKDKVGAASKRMSTALIGMVILLSTYAVFKLVNYFFGIDVLNLVIPTISD